EPAATQPAEATTNPSETQPTEPTTKPAEPTEKPAQEVAGGTSVKGKVVFNGKPPAMPVLGVNSVAQCAAMHKGREVHDTAVIVNGDGTLANVVVYVSGGLPQGQDFPQRKEPVVLDQKGC